MVSAMRSRSFGLGGLSATYGTVCVHILYVFYPEGFAMLYATLWATRLTLNQHVPGASASGGGSLQRMGGAAEEQLASGTEAPSSHVPDPAVTPLMLERCYVLSRLRDLHIQSCALTGSGPTGSHPITSGPPSTTWRPQCFDKCREHDRAGWVSGEQRESPREQAAVASQRLVLGHITSHHIISHHITSHHITSHHITTVQGAY